MHEILNINQKQFYKIFMLKQAHILYPSNLQGEPLGGISNVNNLKLD